MMSETKIGRPPEMEERLRLQIFVDRELYDRIQALARRRGVTVSSLGRRLLATHRALKGKR